MAHPEWHRHPGVLVAVRGAGPGPVPAYVVGSAAPGRRPPIVVAVRDGDEWVPFVARPHQVLTTWESWRRLILAAVHEHGSQAERRSTAGSHRPAVGAAL